MSRCTAMAVDGLSAKLFFVDGPSNAIWRLNIDGTGLTLVRANLTGAPMDLALDVLNQRVYFTTSSTIQTNNTVQAMDYTGAALTPIFVAGGSAGNGVSRCTAIALDTQNAKVFLADAGAAKVWSMNLAGGNLTALTTTPSNSFPTSVALDKVNQRVYFNASSATQNLNLIRRVNYDGSGLATVFAASGAVARCTALDLDASAGAIYLSDAGANTIWRVPLSSGVATALASGLPATAKRVRYFNGPFSRPAPDMTGIKVSETKVVITATNGFVGGTYYLLTSTNLETPLHLWTPISSTLLGGSGNFSLTTTNGPGTGASKQFYVLSVE